jgi:uncharacterized membrane protein
MELTHFFLRWIHLLAGVTWIGILYYFNFVQTPFFAETEAPVRIGAIQKLVPRALWWFRWGAMITFLAGALMYFMRLGQLGNAAFFSSSYGVAITLGGLIGTIMFLNVWLVIWPNQQIVMASTNQVAGGGQALPNAAGAGRRAALTSRTNTVFSIPMLFFMGAASHYPSLLSAAPAFGSFWVLCLIIIAVVEINALVGTQGATKKPLDSVSGALWTGFILNVLFYLLCLVLL